MDTHGDGAVTFHRWSGLAGRDRLTPALDRIFFAASNTKSFDSDAVRAAFRKRWLGRYLDDMPELAHLMFLAPEPAADALAGYVVGDLADPAGRARYDDIGYFHLLADKTRYFPAHLHINLREDARGRGLGSRLLQRFIDDAAGARCPGVHVVTGANLRNVGFYLRNGFAPRHTFAWKGNELVMLGRAVA